MKIILIERKRTLCPFLASIMIRYSTICHCVVLYDLIIGILNVFLLLKVSWTFCPIFRQIYNNTIVLNPKFIVDQKSILDLNFFTQNLLDPKLIVDPTFFVSNILSTLTFFAKLSPSSNFSSVGG